LQSLRQRSQTDSDPSAPQMGHRLGQTQRKPSLKKLLDKDLRSFIKVV